MSIKKMVRRSAQLGCHGIAVLRVGHLSVFPRDSGCGAAGNR